MELMLQDEDAQYAITKGLNQFDQDQYLSRQTARANLEALEQGKGKVSASPYQIEKPKS